MVSTLLKNILIAILKTYKRLISPLLGNHCRFYPSCSNYAIECLQKYNLIKATYKSIYRIFRCSPISCGGNDPA